MKLNISKLSVSALVLACMAFAGCTEGDDFDYNQCGVLITGTEVDPITRFVVEDTPASYAITAQSTKKATKDIYVNLKIDYSLVEKYNAENNAAYFPVPEGCAVLDNRELTIKKGSALSNSATVRIVSTEGFEDGRTYIIPVTIEALVNKTEAAVVEKSRTIYLRVARYVQFTSLVNDYRFSSNYIFPDEKAVNLTNFTFEIKVRADRYGSRGGQIERVCAFEEADESNASMLRFGENGYEGNQLQWVSPAGSIVSTTRFQPNQWYMISLVYDGNEFTMYVNGVRDTGTTLSGKNCKFQRFELGMSWGGYNSGQFFPGRMAEARVWNRALSATELANGTCAIDPKSKGLVAYWKMNDGDLDVTTVFHDSTGNGYDMDWNDTSRADNEGPMIHHDNYGNLLKWVNDENNKCVL